MNQNYYPIDFEAQYEQTSEKMIQITTKNKDKIRSIKPIALELLQEQLEQIQVNIDERELQFRKQSIYSQFASGQLMAEKRKQPPQMCPECGDELKKQIQCEFCAELYCPKCCSRKRVIPFVSKEIRLCCEQCHWKFVKLFDNKNFYEEKQKLANVIHFVKNKILKINEKIVVKSQEVEQYKKIKREQKIKQKALDGKIVQEEKKLRQIQDELRKVVSEKAQKMVEQQRRKKKEEEQRQKAREAQKQRERIQELQRNMEEQRSKKAKQLQQQINLSSSQKKIQIEQMEKGLLQTLKKKEQELRLREQMLLKKQQQIKKKKEPSNDGKSNKSGSSIVKDQTPKQSIGKNSSDKQKMIDTADSKSKNRRSRRESEEIKKKQYRIDSVFNQNLVKTQVTKSTTEQPLTKKLSKQQQKQLKGEDQPSDSLERSLVNMFKSKKDDDAKSLYSNISKNTKSILDMSVNQLLAVRIPVVRNNSKVQEQQKPTTVNVQTPKKAEEQEQAVPVITPNRKTMDLRSSIKVEEEEQIKQDQLKMHKDSILRNSSLMTSTQNASTAQQEVTPQKCACSIM